MLLHAAEQYSTAQVEYGTGALKRVGVYVVYTVL
jgi:hypothetical protein